MAPDTTDPIAAEESGDAASAFKRLGAVIAALLLRLARKRVITARDQRIFQLRVQRELEVATRRAERAVARAVDAALNEAARLFPDVELDLSFIRDRTVAEITDRLQGAADAASRRASTRISRLILRRIAWGLQADEAGESIATSVEKALAGQARTPNVADLVRDIDEQKYVRDASGRNWRLNTYAEMVTRTNAARAHNEAVKALATEAGIDLVRVTMTASACAEICTQYQGKIYSLSGVDGRYERLPRTPPFHPNCVHRLIPVAPGSAAAR